MSVNNNLQTGPGRVRIATFTASGSWVAPAGVYSVQALAVGGGGGGGFAKTNSAEQVQFGGGGGGGGVFDGLLPVVPGTTYTITVGIGGNGASTSTAAAGSNGSDTTFGSIMTAPGGQGGVGIVHGTGTIPATNPGGSSGGIAVASTTAAAVTSIVGGHGAGASTPIVAVLSTSAPPNPLTGNQLVHNLSFFDGVSNRTVPQFFNFAAASESKFSSGVFPGPATNHFHNIKRNINPQHLPVNVSYIPGFPWKNLGAGGASFLPGRFNTLDGVTWGFNGVYRLIHYTAGIITNPTTATVTASTVGGSNGTNGFDNSGAGGGGSRAANTTGSGNGGNGGSGFLEVVWQE